MKPENRWPLWAFEEINPMPTHIQTGEHRPDPDFDRCPDCHKVYSQCDCPMETEEPEFLGEEPDA